MSDLRPPPKTRQACPGWSELVDFRAGLLAGEAAAHILSHSESCESCNAVIGQSARIDEIVAGKRAERIAPGDQAARQELARRVNVGVDRAIEQWRSQQAAEAPPEPVQPAPGSPQRPRATVASLQARRRPRSTSWWTPAAAALAASLALFAVSRPSSLLEGPAPSLRIGRIVDSGQLELGEGWQTHGWPVTRGVTGYLSEEETAFQLGAWQVDLHVALGRDERAAAIRAVANVNALLETVEFAEPAMIYYDELRRRIDAGPDDGELLAFAQEAEAFFDSMELVSSLHVALGKWTEGGRLAAVSGDLDYFQKGSVRSFPARFLARADASADVEQELAAVQALLKTRDVPPPLPALKQHLDRIAALGGAR